MFFDSLTGRALVKVLPVGDDEDEDDSETVDLLTHKDDENIENLRLQQKKDFDPILENPENVTK